MPYHNEQALLSAGMLVDWKKKRGVYNFDKLPAKAIITLGSNIVKRHRGFFTPKLKGIAGNHFAKDTYVLSGDFGSGAPALITLMEELRVLGVREFIFIGLCASIGNNIISGQAFYIDKALSGNGVTAFYTPEKIIQPYNLSYVAEIGRHCAASAASCISTDSPFRETPSFIEQALENNCTLLEMECAAAYAFSQFYQLNVACLQVVADTIWPAWKPPADMAGLVMAQQKLVDKIIQNRL